MTGIYKPKILVIKIKISLFTNLHFLLKRNDYVFFILMGLESYALKLSSTMSRQSSILGKAEEF